MSFISDLNPFKTPTPKAASTMVPQSQEALQLGLNAAKGIDAKGYTPYAGPRVAGVNPNDLQVQANKTAQTTGLDKRYYDPAAGLATQSGASFNERYDPNAIDFDKVTTELWNGGAANRYMNPYIDATLSPVLDQIRRSSALTQNTIGSRAASHNAFGGTGKDRLEIANNRDTMAQEANSTNQVRSDAYATGLQAFLADMARKLTADTTNQSTGVDVSKFNENQIMQAIFGNAGVWDMNRDNERAASESLKGIGDSQLAKNKQNFEQNSSAAATQRGINQQVYDTDYQKFLDSINQAPGGQQSLENYLQVATAGNGGQTNIPGQNLATQVAGLVSAVTGASKKA